MAADEAIVKHHDETVYLVRVARWKKREWQAEARLEHPLAAAIRKIDLFVPLLTGDPTTKMLGFHRQSWTTI